MYVDLSSIHTKQTVANYKTVQARLLSLYTKNNVIADYDTNLTFYSQQPNAPVTMTAWKNIKTNILCRKWVSYRYITAATVSKGLRSTRGGAK